MRPLLSVVRNIFNLILKILLVIVFAAIQIALVYFFFFYLQSYAIVYWSVVCLTIFPVVRIYNSEQNISFKMTWIVFILAIPFVGTMCYFIYGNRKTLPRKINKEVEKYINENKIDDTNIESLKNKNRVSYKLSKMLSINTKLPLYKDGEVTFINDGTPWLDNLLSDIEKAQKYIFLEYFIISDGIFLKKLEDILIRKALAGVEIKIIFDDLGSKLSLKKETVSNLNSHKNIKMVSYNPMGYVFSLRLNYRNHRKIAIIDGQIAYCGGTNIADEYVHLKERFGFFRDNVCRYTGGSIYSFLLIFCTDWYLSTLKKLNVKDYLLHSFEPSKDDNYIFPFMDGPTIKENPAYNLFVSLIENAQKTLYICTPYFIIDNDFISSLKNAVKSGVDVKLLIPHIPDKKIILNISRGHLGKLLKAGVEIYEFMPGFTHAKNFIVDDLYTFNGTVNLDYRSLFLHSECGAFHINKTLNKEMKADFLQAIEKSRQITYQEWKKRPMHRRVIEFIATLLAPLL